MRLQRIVMYYRGSKRVDISPRVRFKDQVEYILVYLYRCIWALKFESKDFNRIIIEVDTDYPTYVYNKTLIISSPFDEERFEECERTGNWDYYIELIVSALDKAKDDYDIPYAQIMEFIREGEKCGFETSGVMKKLNLKDYDLKCEFERVLNQKALTLYGKFTRRSTKEEICRGVIFRSEPDINTTGLYSRDIIERDGFLVIQTPYTSEDIALIDINDILAGQIKVKFVTPELDYIKWFTFSGNQ